MDHKNVRGRFGHVWVTVALAIAALLLAGCTSRAPPVRTTLPDGSVVEGENVGPGENPDTRCFKIFSANQEVGQYTQVSCGDGNGDYLVSLTGCDPAQALIYQAAPTSGRVHVKIVGAGQTLVDRDVDSDDGLVMENVGNGSGAYAVTMDRSDGFTGSVSLIAPCAS